MCKGKQKQGNGIGYSWVLSINPLSFTLFTVTLQQRNNVQILAKKQRTDIYGRKEIQTNHRYGSTAIR